MKRFEEMYVSEQNPFFKSFGKKANFFRIFVRGFCSMVVKTAFCVSVGNIRGGFRFWGNVFFVLENIENFFAFLSETFWHGCQNCFLRVHWNNSGMIYLKKNVQVFILSHFDRKSCTIMANFSWPSGYIVSAGLKLLSIYPQEPFEWVSFFSERNVKFLTIPDTEWKNFVHLSKIFGPGSPNWFLRKQR